MNDLVTLGKDTRFSGERAVEIGRRGGQVKSIHKKLAQQIRRAKERGFTNRDIDMMVQRLVDPQCSELNIMEWIEEVKRDVHPSQRVALINVLVSLHKTMHGDKKPLIAIQNNTTGGSVTINIIEHGNSEQSDN